MAREISDEQELRKVLKEKPIVVFFYMDGCPHCERTMSPWKSLCKSGLPYSFFQVESSHVSPELGISGFPHFEVVHENGEKTSLDGARESKEDLEKELKLKKKKSTGGKRRRTARRKRTRRTIRRIRK